MNINPVWSPAEDPPRRAAVPFSHPASVSSERGLDRVGTFASARSFYSRRRFGLPFIGKPSGAFLGFLNVSYNASSPACMQCTRGAA